MTERTYKQVYIQNELAKKVKIVAIVEGKKYQEVLDQIIEEHFDKIEEGNK